MPSPSTLLEEHHLPDEAALTSEPPICRKALLKMLGVALSVFVLFLLLAEGGARVYTAYAKPLLGHSYNFDQKYELMLSAKHDYKKKPFVILLGDSTVDRGIFSEELMRVLDRNGVKIDVLNLGIRGGYLDQMRFMLNELVKRDTPPQLVILGLNRRSLQTKNALDRKMEIPVRQSYIGRCYMYPPTHFLGKLDCGLAEHSYLYRYRSRLRDLLVSIPEAVENPQRFQFNRPALSMSQHGWSPLYETMNLKKALSKKKAHLVNQRERLHTYSEKPLMDMLDYCKQHHIPIMLTWIPRHEAYVQTLDPHNAALYQRIRENVRHRYPAWGVPYLDMEFVPLETTDFFNEGHMNATGSLKFTEALGEKLSQEPYRHLLMPQPKADRDRKNRKHAS